MRRIVGLTLLLCLLLAGSGLAPAGAQDARLKELRTLDSHFPPPAPASKDEWQEQAEKIRTRIRLAMGIWPPPEMAEPQPTIHSRRELEGYSIEAIYFESLPGFYVTGNLYRPLQEGDKPAPVVLCPHGHWHEGRFFDAGEQGARNLIASGAERFESAARNPIQARCVQLARMGCVVLQWDMIGYADADQISLDRAHGFREQDKATAVTEEGWLLFSPQAESHLQSVMGLQTLNALQAVRVAQSLPGVDPERIAITGASGGGTQTFITAAIEPEIAAAFPAVMVSTGMQGGCTCENACLLRIGIGNVDIAGCIAPRPLGLTAADDWTRTMPDDGFPQLQRLYGLFDAKGRVELTPLLHFPHNYNHVSRVALYNWINKIFDLGFETPVLESDFQRLEPEQLTVWNDEHPLPTSGLDFERQLLQRWHEETESTLREAVQVAGEDDAKSFLEIVRPAIETLVDREPADYQKPEFELVEKRDEGDALIMRGVLASDSDDQRRPVFFHYPKDWNGQVTMVLHADGIAGVAALLDDPESEVAAVAKAGGCVAAIDLLGQHPQDGLEGDAQPLVREDRLAAAYTYGYNPPLLVHQAQDALMFVAFIRGHERDAQRLTLLGIDAMAPVVALAGAVAGDAVDACEVAPGGFRFADVDDIQHPSFLPGGARYLDLPGILALHAPRPLTIRTESPDDYAATQKIYAAAGAPDHLQLQEGKSADP